MSSISQVEPSNRTGQLSALARTESIELAPISSTRKDSGVADTNNPESVQTEGAVFPARTASHRRRERIHLLALYWTLLLAGWNDASTGPLLPRIQKNYHLGFTIVSILFITACCVSLVALHDSDAKLTGSKRDSSLEQLLM
jgi:hypothetical protein